MKARLIKCNEQIQLLLCTGRILTVDKSEARTFLLNFDDKKYYKGTGTWDYEDLTMEEYAGETIAYVDDRNILRVKNSALLRNIFETNSTKWLTVKEYAELHGKKTAIVRRLCSQERLTGAVYKGGAWLIPADCPYPRDERFNAGAM